MKKTVKLDKIDYKILKMLMTDSRTSLSEIARKSKTSVSNIRNRFNRLKDRGIIKGEIMDINPGVLGYKIIATIVLEIVSSAFSNISAQLRSTSGVLAVAKGFGRRNVICFVATRNTDELTHLVETIRNIPGVLETETNLKVGSKRGSYPENLQFREMIN